MSQTYDRISNQDSTVRHEHIMNYGRDGWSDYTCRNCHKIPCLYNAIKIIPTTSGWKTAERTNNYRLVK